VDTTKKMTVITQFVTDDNTDTGTLKEIKRFYMQDGRVIPNPTVTIGGMTYNSITQETCDNQKKTWKEPNDFGKAGGMKNMGEALRRGMTLVMSIWDDHDVNMLWLDSIFPLDQRGQPGAARGRCSTDSGKPEDVESQYPNSKVIFSEVKYGPINSTFPHYQLDEQEKMEELELEILE
jgi:cellulose 1,4-beta-cellobiosidase